MEQKDPISTQRQCSSLSHTLPVFAMISFPLKHFRCDSEEGEMELCPLTGPMNPRRKIGAHSQQGKRTAVLQFVAEWNGMEDTCALSDDRAAHHPPAHFSLFPCFRGWWMVARRLGGWFLAVSRFCFDPLSVRSTLIAGAKKRSDCRGKKPNRMHGFGG